MGVDLRFTAADAQIKLKHSYPAVQSSRPTRPRWLGLFALRMEAPDLLRVPADAGDVLDDLADRPRLAAGRVERLGVEAAQPQRVDLAQPAQPVAGLVEVGLGEGRPAGMSLVGALTRGRPSQASQVAAMSRQVWTASGISSAGSPRTEVVMACVLPRRWAVPPWPG